MCLSFVMRGSLFMGGSFARQFNRDVILWKNNFLNRREFGCSYHLSRAYFSPISPNLKYIDRKQTSTFFDAGIREFSKMSSIKKGDDKPKESAKNKSHTGLWLAERLTGLGVLGLFPVAFWYPHPILETVIAVCAVTHNFWGFKAIVGDYIQPAKFGRLIPKIAHFMTYLLSIVTLAGLFQIIFNDYGLIETIKMFWEL